MSSPVWNVLILIVLCQCIAIFFRSGQDVEKCEGKLYILQATVNLSLFIFSIIFK